MHRSKACRDRTKLIIFLGTPHRGSPYASWGQIASNLARIALQDPNKKVLETLEVNSEVLDNIHEEFKSIVHEGGMEIHSFQEARGITGIKGLNRKACTSYIPYIPYMPHIHTNAKNRRLWMISHQNSIFQKH
jgi:hypothetical protein